ncbi:kell blood group glycoprotein isoform X2 [Boleophthalmus pectinirostris]|uniref:kell blood group glycoprotein isoform X2 n=1 Tax=Boleophthalmus pectinirostris TaxID=150288 RepID=UPI00242AAA09|nr:kell blood group glycoprotein isoform X2 [Boleophthalmus pectinirostris]
MMIMPETPTEREQSQIELEVQSQTELPESSSELGQRGRSDEDEAPQTTQRRRLFLLLVWSFCLCAFIIVLIYTLHHFQTRPVRSCKSEACLQVSAHLSAFADPFTQPCDFYLYTCLSDWRKGRQRGPGLPGPPGARQDQRPSPQHVDQRLRKKKLTDRKTLLLQYLKDTLESNDKLASSAEQKAKMFYHSCLDTRSIETAGAEPFLKLIENLGGWAVTDQKWNQTDLNSTLGLLMRNYGTFPFFNLLVGKDPNESSQQTSRNYIQIDQPDLLIPIDFNSQTEKSEAKTETLRPFFSMCTRYLSLLGAPQRDSLNHVGQFISLSSELAVATAPLEYRLAKGQLYQRMTIRELQSQAPVIDWLGCLQMAFEPVSLTEDDPVLVHNLPYIIKMSQIISDWLNKPEYSNSFPLHTYMIFNLLHTMIPALDYRFKETVEQIEPRWKSCVLETERGFGSVLTHFLNKRTAHAEVNEIIENMVTSLKSKLHGLQWNNPKTHKAVVKKVNSLTHKKWTSNQTNEAEFDNFFAEITMGSTFFWNYAQLLSLWQKSRIKLLEEQSEGVDILSVSPVLNRKELVFPLGMFVPPLFHPTYPRAFNYGVTGFLIAKDILHLLLPDVHGHSESVAQVANCVWTYYLNAKDRSRAGGNSLSRAQQQEVWVQYSALELALQAYQQSLKSNPSDTSLSGLSHTNLFLSAFSQFNCDLDPYHDSMPLESSFLVKVLCAKSELCVLHCAKEKYQPALKSC